MARQETTYACKECGGAHTRWQGKCNYCGNWNTLEESQSSVSSSSKKKGKVITPKLLTDIVIDKKIRLSTGSSELDRVLGGGLVAGSLILIGGSPGAGKSTLLMQAMANLTQDNQVCYVSGEESSSQIALHSRRLGLEKHSIYVLAENNLSNILASMHHLKPKVLVIDSIQVMHTDEQSGSAGGVSQVRECAMRLMEFAKSTSCVVLIVGHVTKEGSLAGPRVLEHLVDASLLLESTKDARYRTLRAMKNRFGRVNEIGVFGMTEKGLKDVSNPSAIFLSQTDESSPGSTTAVVREGTRPMLVEIQALVDPQISAYSRNITAGLDVNRMGLLMAVLNCHCGISPKNNNVYINVVGGLRVEETATDLPVLLAVTSVLRKQPLPQNFAVFGELGLNGEIRPSSYGQERIEAAQRHGFTRIMVPHANAPGKSNACEIIPVTNINKAIEAAFSSDARKTKKR